MNNVEWITKVGQCFSMISDIEKSIGKKEIEIARTKYRLQKSRMENGEIQTELNDLQFLRTELEKNAELLPDGDNKDLHLDRISELKRRRIIIEKRQPFYGPDLYEYAELAIRQDSESLVRMKLQIEQLEARKVALQAIKEEEKRVSTADPTSTENTKIIQLSPRDKKEADDNSESTEL